jgi:hypothetical protein
MHMTAHSEHQGVWARPREESWPSFALRVRRLLFTWRPGSVLIRSINTVHPHLVHVLGYVAGQQIDSAAPRLVPAQRCVVLQPVAAAVHVHRQVAHVAGWVHALQQQITMESTPPISIVKESNRLRLHRCAVAPAASSSAAGSTRRGTELQARLMSCNNRQHAQPASLEEHPACQCAPYRECSCNLAAGRQRLPGLLCLLPPAAAHRV